MIDRYSEVLATEKKRVRVLRRAATMITNRYDRYDDDFFLLDYYSNRRNIMTQAVLMYTMRPQLRHNTHSNEIVNRLIPSNFHESRAAGFLIRKSDNCGDETMCADFAAYMERAERELVVEKPTRSSVLFVKQTFVTLAGLIQFVHFAAGDPRFLSLAR
jgi:hypothetical protein